MKLARPSHIIRCDVLLLALLITLLDGSHGRRLETSTGPMQLGTGIRLNQRQTTFGNTQLVLDASFRPTDPDSINVRSAYADCQEEQQVYRKANYAYSRAENGHYSKGNGKIMACAAIATSSKTKPAPSVSNVALPPTSPSTATVAAEDTARGGSALIIPRPLLFWENMVCGAISRSVAQTVMHPANTAKTILQSSRGTARPTLWELSKPENFGVLLRGAGANFILSVPHGAVNFAVLEFIRSKLNKIVEQTSGLRERADKIGPGLDFLSSSISTICCSIVSTPQMMITDNIMAGNYPNLPAAINGLASTQGIKGFYAGWWPGLAGKIPSYALTWTLFQQLKAANERILQRPPTDIENSIMGCIASATTVTIMIPMDTIKTRLVTQASMAATSGIVPYKGIVDCAVRIAREEGMGVFYRGLAPRLISVVPMIGIQFGVYEYMKRTMLDRAIKSEIREKEEEDTYGKLENLEEAAMEVAASNSQPFPAPHFHSKYKAFMENRRDKRARKKAKASTANQ